MIIAKCTEFKSLPKVEVTQLDPGTDPQVARQKTDQRGHAAINTVFLELIHARAHLTVQFIQPVRQPPGIRTVEPSKVLL